MEPQLEIPGYTIQSIIGQGGMAKVFLSIQKTLDREVALKVMNKSLASDHVFCERFLKEGKIVAQLSAHHDIVTIHDIGCHNSHYYMAMEYVSGTNLKQRIQHNSALEQPLKIIKQIASALGYAHQRGFIHRDVKPANILFREDGSAVLTDFGIAKSVSSNTQLTMIGYTVGTPEYMSPEQAVGKPMDSRSDLYSLGVVLYEILTRQKPYTSDDAFSTALMHVNSPIPILPAGLTAYQPLIDRLLAKDPNDRFENAQQIIDYIDDFPKRMRATRQIEAKPSVSAPRSKKPRGSHPLLKWGTLAGISLAAVITGVVLSLKIDELPVPPTVQNEDPPLNQEEKARVTRLLDIAEAHAAIGRLQEPPGSNAYEAYQSVLETDPDNEQAKQGMRAIERIVKQQEL